MKTKEEFKKLMDEIFDVVFKESVKSKGPKFEIPIVTKNVLYMLMNLNQQIEEQREHASKLEEQAKKLEERIKILIKELKTLGYLNIKERRKPLKRAILTQDAFINLLKNKGVITKKELLEEIEKLRKKGS